MTTFHYQEHQSFSNCTTKLPELKHAQFMDNKDILEGGALDNIDSRHPESADESQVHGRKMLRRVANRRSAQQSRARKKVNSRAF